MSDKKICFVLGGCKSGKSELAEKIAADWAGGAPVNYIAFLTRDVDQSWEERLKKHRLRRPPHWLTYEVKEKELIEVLNSLQGVVLIDSLAAWIAGYPDLNPDKDSLIAALRTRHEPSIVVSDEVGLGVHPSYPSGIAFREALGDLNLAISQIADQCYFVISGRLVQLGNYLI